MSAAAVAERPKARTKVAQVVAAVAEPQNQWPDDSAVEEPVRDRLPLDVIDFACSKLYQAIGILQVVETAVGGDTEPFEHLPELTERAMRRIDTLLEVVENSWWDAPGRPISYEFESLHFEARGLVHLFRGAAFYDAMSGMDFKFDMDITCGMLVAIREALKELNDQLQACERITEGAQR